MGELAHTGSQELIFKISGILSLYGANSIPTSFPPREVNLRPPILQTFLEYHTCASYCAGYCETVIKRDNGTFSLGAYSLWEWRWDSYRIITQINT